MLRLRTFGTAILERDGGPLSGPATQRRRIALLVLLASSWEVGISRDKLVALLWPDRDESARHVLNQTLYALRRELSADDLILGTDPVRLNPVALTVDFVEFELAITRGELERAAELYLGPFLEGFHLGHGGEFERWQESTRSQFAARQHHALTTLATNAEQQGDHTTALRWWRRLAALEPLDATAAVGVMRVLAASGNRAGALQHARIYEVLVRAELDAIPDSRVTTLAARLKDTMEHEVPRSTQRAPPPPPPDEPTPRADQPNETRARATPFRLRPPPVVQIEVAPLSKRSLSVASRALVALMLILGVAGLGWIAFAGVRRSHAANARAPYENRVVVLPFAVHGGSAYQYLSRGVVDLLGTSLNGADGLQNVDARGAIGRVARSDSTGTAYGHEIAARVGAGQFVVGDLTEVNGQVRLDATLYDGRGPAPIVVARGIAQGLAKNLFAVADSVVAQLIVGRGAERDSDFARLAAKATPLAALKAYLEGDRAFQARRLGVAADAFRRAVAIDSNFTMGWYRIAAVASWTLEPDEARQAALHALRTSAHLPDRARELTSAMEAYVAGRADDAEHSYRALLAKNLDDVEAWRGLGEVMFHYNWRRGRSSEESRSAWEHVLRAEPDDWGALHHLSEVAARQRRSTELDSLVRRQLRGDTADPAYLPIRALHASVNGDRAASERILGELRKSTHLWTMLAASEDAVAGGNLDDAARLARLLIDPSRRPEVRTLGHVTLAHLALAAGRWREARTELRALDSLDQRLASEYTALLIAAPFVPATAEEIRSARANLLAWNPGSEASRDVTPSPWIDVQHSVEPQVRQYLLGVLALRLGDREDARRRADSLEQRVGTPDAQLLARSLALGVRFELSANGHAVAVPAVDPASDTDLPFALAWLSPYYSFSLARYQHAERLAAEGRTQEAIREYGTFDDNSLFDLIFAAPSRLARARLLERAGERLSAAEEYRAFVSLWKECDPELRPLVAEAEAALVRIGRVDRKLTGI